MAGSTGDDSTGLRPSEAEKARQARIQWMREMGLDDEQISEDLEREPPTDLDAELEQLAALYRLRKITPTYEALSRAAIHYEQENSPSPPEGRQGAEACPGLPHLSEDRHP